METPDGNFYYAGDTALTMDMKLIGEDTRLDFAVLPIGDNFTMGAKDAARAAEFVGATDVVGVHYDTFPPIRIDHAKAREAFRRGEGRSIFRKSEKPSACEFPLQLSGNRILLI